MEIKCGEFVVAGTKFSLRDRGLTIDDLKALTKEATMHLDREPNNEYDKNAIIVSHENKHFGYVPATLAKHFAPMIDNGAEFYLKVMAVNPTTQLIKVELVWESNQDELFDLTEGYDPDSDDNKE